MINANRKALLTLYVSAVLLSCNGLFANGIALDATSLSQLRSVIAVVALVCFYVWRRQRLSLPRKRDYLRTYCLGVLLGLHWVTFFGAMQAASVAIGMIAIFSYPVMTVILEPALDKKLPKLSDIIAGLVVLIGISIMVPESTATGWQANTTTATGVGLGLISALLFAIRNTLQGRLLHNIDASTSTLHQFFIIGLMLMPFVDWPATAALVTADIGKLLVLGVITTAIAHSLLVAALRSLPAKSVAMIGCIQPPLGALLAWLILGEALSLQVFIGGAIVLSVALWETWRSR